MNSDNNSSQIIRYPSNANSTDKRKRSCNLDFEDKERVNYTSVVVAELPKVQKFTSIFLQRPCQRRQMPTHLSYVQRGRANLEYIKDSIVRQSFEENSNYRVNFSAARKWTKSD